jgi:nucleoid DNA-binding protein
MKKFPTTTINKRKLGSLVAKRLGYSIHHTHISNVISLFIDSFMDELQDKQRIDIGNFGSFRLEKTKPRKFHNIQKRRFAVSAGRPRLKIKLSRSLRAKIIRNLDLVKTFI